ncbi:MAG: hypothetical protein OJF61_000913 [Rhodanobacteraceae bacterium]|nr:MAG: hypothetical protein OJF61_000913 [Rhodanobacteraceae bacterium]
MNRRPAFTLAAALATIACAAPAFPQTPAASTANDRTAVTRLEHRWLAAVSPGGDRGALNGVLADDYVDTDWQGHLRNKADLLHGTTAKDVTEHVTGMRVRVWDDTAVATGINHMHSGTKGWSVDVAFTDVFSRIDGRWRAVSLQETLRKSTQAAH